MPKSRPKIATQFAALPFGAEDAPQVMLITSRETRRWVLPKGWTIKGLKPPQVALREAYEEAGLVGRIVGKRPVGAFYYEKNMTENRQSCRVWVFLMRVDNQLDDWPEKDQRETRWFDPLEAAGLVAENDLQDLLRKLASRVPGKRTEA